MVEGENIPDEKDIQSLTLDKKTMDVLVANIIPTSKYFEVRFDHMQIQINRTNNDINKFHTDVDKRFDSMKIDMDQRLDQMITSINRVTDTLEQRGSKQRGFTIRMFTISIGISFVGALGAFLKSMGLI